MALTHNHNCDHCEQVLSCKQERCILPRNVSSLHGCPERELFKRRMAKALRDKGCKHGCSSLPCRHRGAIVFPRKGRFVVSDPCPHGCVNDKDMAIAREKCPTHYRAKLPEKPVIDTATRGHVDNCVCKGCKQSFASEHQPARPNFAFKSILASDRAAMLPEPRSERERALAAIVARNSGNREGR